MVPSTLFTFLISSLVAVNGAIVPRDGHSAAANSTAPPSGSPSVPPNSTFPVSSGTVSVPPVTNSTSPCVTPTVSNPITTQTTPPASSGTIVPTSTPSAAPSGGSANCNGAQQWQAAFAYTAGNRVIFNNQLYTAKQWTYNNSPPAHPDQWAADGICSQPINNQANCNGISAWQSTVAYGSGNQVTHNGHLWSAVQWTTSNSPGDNSGTWQDLGACA